MKILFIIPGLAIAGQEKIGMMLTTSLMKYHEVVTVCFEREDPRQFNYTTPIIRIENKIYKSPVLKLLNIFKRVIALRKIKKSYKPDVSISFGETAIIANAFTYTRELKIASMHTSLKFFTRFKPLYKMAYKLHDKIIPVSNGINHDLKEFYGINNNLFIYNGFDIAAIGNAANEQLPENADSFFNGNVIVHLGRITLQKGHWHLIIFFVLIKRTVPKAKLLLIGDYNPVDELFTFCMDYLAKRGLKTAFLQREENIDFSKIDVLITGHQSNPFKFLSRANIFVFPSIWEGFGNALVEAMACGLPVIAANCPSGPGEILRCVSEKKEYGVLMTPFKLDFSVTGITTTKLHEQWAKKIIELLNNKDQMQLYKKLSLKRCLDFTIEKCCESWLEIIEQKKSKEIRGRKANPAN